jgi:hypothetical protein
LPPTGALASTFTVATIPGPALKQDDAARKWRYDRLVKVVESTPARLEQVARDVAELAAILAVPAIPMTLPHEPPDAVAWLRRQLAGLGKDGA